MSRAVVGTSGALVILILGFLTAFVGRKALPIMSETPGQYVGRLFAHTSVIAEDLYVRALLLLPGTAKVVVKSNVDANHGSVFEQSSEAKVEQQDKLKQRLAKDETEINAQQEVSSKRYAEILKEKQSSNDEPLLIPEQPDDVRSRMPTVDPAGPEMRCGKKLLTESSLITRDVELQAEAQFMGKHGDQYSWKYIIKFINHGTDTVQMLTRHWVFVDSSGRLDAEVKGPGARGVTPVLPPGGEWIYESGTSLPTSFGSMHGSFQFEILKGRPTPDGKMSFSARVARVLLSSNAKEKGREVPCVDTTHGEPLPLTSVLSIERVILGGRSQSSGQKNVKKNGEKKKVYKFHYDVQFNNAREKAIEIVAHSWEVVDSNRKRTVIVEGEGVGGSLGNRARSLAAGDAFRVQGELTSATPEANAQGTYKVIVKNEDGTFREIEARTDWMGMAASSSKTHVPNFVVDPNFA